MATVQITEMNLVNISKEDLQEAANHARTVVDNGRCTSAGSLALMEAFAEACEGKIEDMETGRDG